LNKETIYRMIRLMDVKRLTVGTLAGALLGVVCILGVAQRLPASPVPSAPLYLANAWFQRLIMGVLVGLAGGIRLLGAPSSLPNAALRGLLIGALTSVGFAFLGQQVTWTYFFAGLGFGLIADLATTALVRRDEPGSSPRRGDR
jgi:hypothetical protein